MKPNLNNEWGRTLSNLVRGHLNLPPTAAGGDGALNTVIGEDKYLLALEAAGVEDVALLSLLKKVDPFSAGAGLLALLQQTSIDKRLPAPVHVAMKAPDTLVTTLRIHKQRDTERLLRLLDLLFSIHENASAQAPE